MGDDDTIPAPFTVDYRESDFGCVRPICVASVRKFNSAGSRLWGDQMAENGMASGSSTIGRKIRFGVHAAAVSSTKSETPCPEAITDNSALRPVSTRRIVGVGHFPAERSTMRS